MTTRKIDNNEPKGFAGLEQFVSEINDDIDQEFSQNEPEYDSSESKSTAIGTTAPARRENKFKSLMSRVDWNKVLGIIAIIAFLGIAIIGKKKPEDAPAPAAFPAESPSNQTSSTIEKALWEVKPPVGSDNLLDQHQIAYCQAEKIRLGAMKEAVDAYEHVQVVTYNKYIEDFNARCSHYRYRSGVLEAAIRDVEALRTELYAEGRRRITNLYAQKSTLKKRKKKKIDYSGLSEDDIVFVKSICSDEKQLNGNDAYNRCLEREISNLKK